MCQNKKEWKLFVKYTFNVPNKSFNQVINSALSFALWKEVRHINREMNMDCVRTLIIGAQ